MFLIVPTSHTNTHAHTHAHTCIHTQTRIHTNRVGQNHTYTMYIQCFCRESTKNMVFIYGYGQPYIPTNMHTHKNTYTQSYTQTRTHRYMHIHTNTHTHRYTQTHTHMYTNTLKHTNTQTHIQTINEYVHIFTQIHSYVTSDMRDAKKSRDSEELTRLRLQNQRLAAGAI